MAAVFVRQMPALQADAAGVLASFPPRSIQQLVDQRDVLLTYAANNPGTALLGWVGLYLGMQTLAIPGTLTLSVLAGALYGVRRGWAMVTVVSTLGSCASFCLSRLLGKQVVAAVWPERLNSFGAEVQRRRSDIFNYIVFLRVTPILPNTFINVASPIVGVPLLPFALGTLVGCAPNNWLAVNAGSRLSELKSLADLTDAHMLTFSALVGCIALLPVWLKHWHRRRQLP